MGQFGSIRNGGKTDENGALRFLRKVSSNGQGPATPNDLVVTQHSSPNRSIDISPGDIAFAYQDYLLWGWSTDAPYNLAIAPNSSGNDRIDAAVAYWDLSVVSAASNNNPGVLKFMDVQGTPGGSPVAPNNTVIQAAVGSGNPFMVLRNVYCTNGFTQIINSNLTNTPTPFLIGSNPKYAWFLPDTAYIANDLGWDPTAPQAQVLQGIYAYVKTAPTGSSLTIQIYNITQNHAIGSISIAAGAQVANTTSLTAASINQGDVLRCDITAIGSSVPGSDISIIAY